MYPPRHVFAVRPYCNVMAVKTVKWQFDQNINLSQKWKMRKSQNDQNTEMHKTQNSILPLRMRVVIFGLRIGSRGTPWNSKSAGPGGSDFAKCQKVPFI